MQFFRVKTQACLLILLINLTPIFSANTGYENKSKNVTVSKSNEVANITTCETLSVSGISCVVTLFLKPFRNDNATLECTSSNPISIAIDFEDVAPINRYSKIITERSCTDYYNRTSCIYKASVDIPTYEERTYKALKYDVMVKYKVFRAGDLAVATNILWHFINDRFELTDVHWFSESYIIKVPDGNKQVMIPCISQSSEINLYRIKNNNIRPGTTTLEKLKGQFISFDILQGFIIIISGYQDYEGKYICTLNGYSEEAVIYEIDWKTYRYRTVYFEIKTPKVLADNILLSSMQSSEKLRKSEIPFEILTGSEIVNFTEWNKELEKRRTAIIPPQGESFGRLVKLGYLKSLDQFTCTTGKNKASLKQMHCNTIYQCELFAKCLFFNDPFEDGLDKIDRLTKCLKSISTESGSCPNTHRYEAMNETALPYSGEDCELAKPIYKKGIVRCSSQNEELISQKLYFEGFDHNIYTNISILPIDAVIQIMEPLVEKLYTGGSFRFTCEAHSFFYEENLIWLLKFKNETIAQIPKEYYDYEDIIESEINTDEDRNPISTIVIHMKKIFLNVVELICAAPVVSKANVWHRVSRKLYVFQSSIPEIIAENTEIEFKIDMSQQSLSCKAMAFPKPEITWTFNNGTVIEEPFSVSDNVFSKILHFPKYTEHYAGEYKCTVTNVAGSSFKVFTVRSFVSPLEYDSVNKALLPTISGVAGFLVVFFTIVILYLIRQRRLKMQKIREMEETIRILNGNVPLENDDDLPGPFQTPYDESFEMERTSFFVDRKRLIGSGQYGEVYKGRMDTVDGDIAIKTVKVNCPTIHLQALVSEMKVLMYIGAHGNIVRMLGSYTKEITKGIIFVALEFCTLGSLESHLKSHRHLFLEDYRKPDTAPANGYLDIEAVNNRFNCNFKTSSKEMLLKWSAQIANAMIYLGLKNVVHFDLAARNVLLTAEGIAKVTDFGLSRILYNYDEYIKNGLELLPWRSLALESLTAKMYSVKSDVWAYGITLYEIFSIGGVPYPGIEFGFDFVRNLEAGFRNVRPQQASPEIYDLMLKCWHPVPEDRPSFENIRRFFEKKLSAEANSIDTNTNATPGYVIVYSYI